MYKLLVKVKKLKNFVDMPKYATDRSSGVDLFAAIENGEYITLMPGETKLIPTGISIEIPPGYEGQVRSRSGLALKNKIVVLNSPGTIDSDYRGEVGVILCNLGQEKFVIKRGDRIAQLVFIPIVQAFLEVGELSNTKRGEGGFGHTGVEHVKNKEK
jgi:dUTP pyrophosphatase